MRDKMLVFKKVDQSLHKKISSFIVQESKKERAQSQYYETIQPMPRTYDDLSMLNIAK